MSSEGDVSFQGFSEGYFAAVAKASQDVLRIVNLDGTVEYMNDRGLELLEIPSFTPNRRKNWADLWPEESREALRVALQEAMEGRPAEFEGYCPTATGKPRWWRTIISPVRDETGGVIRLMAQSRDVSAERRRDARRLATVRTARRAAAARARSLNYLREALEVMPAGLAFYDADDRLVIWNQQYVRAGAGDVEAVHLREGMSFRELLESDLAKGRHPEAVGRETEWLAERLAVRARGRDPEVQELSNGQWYRFEDRRLPDGGIVSVAVDITELKSREAALTETSLNLERAKQAAEAASQSKSAFLANMSHEIRTPLNGVVGMADMLCRARLAPAQHELAEIIRSSGETLERLLSDILDLSRVESGNVTIERAGFNLGDAVRTVVALSQLKAQEKGLSLEFAIDPALDRRVDGDAMRVRQILTNLISNAIKFTEAGRIVLSVAPLQAGMVRFSVEDTGVGFDMAEKDRLFRRFEQADASITRQYAGSGLGLAICQELASLMGGAIDCTSTPGVGTTFWADLRLDAVEAIEAAAPEAPPEVPLEGGLRVLAADDHPVNRKVIEMILREAGAEVTSAGNGAEAVEAFRNGAFDLILMDMQMPVLDGLSAIREIRRIEQDEQRPPTLTMVLSANTLPDHVQASIAAGADGHMAKPITAARLLSAVEEAVGLASAEPTARSA
jgi:PAS domain S-box-containing protein